MRVTNLFAILAALAIAPAALATPITLIEFDNGAASAGNGALFSDPTGVVAGAPVAANGAPGLSTNGFGRGLVSANQNEALAFDNLAAITNNRGVEIDGWGNYRWRYEGGNDAAGFLEAGGRLGQPNEANNGQAFANSSDYVLVSDAYSDLSLGGAGDTYALSVLTGTDTAGGSFGFQTFLVLDDTTFVSIGNQTISSAGQTVNLSGTVGSTYSTLRVVFAVDASNGVRALTDNVSLTVTPIPEPNAVALSLMALAGFGAVGMRTRLG